MNTPRTKAKTEPASGGEAVKKKRGRPPKPADEAKRHYVTVVMADPINTAIREAAERNGRSISSEIDTRLAVSLALEQDTRSVPVRRLIDFTRLAALKLQEDMGAEWTESAEVAGAVLAAVMMYLSDNTQASEADEVFTDDVFSAAQAASAELRKLFEISASSRTRPGADPVSCRESVEGEHQFDTQKWLQETREAHRKLTAGQPNTESKSLAEVVAESHLATSEFLELTGSAAPEKPDMLLRLPDSRVLIVDSKVSPSAPPADAIRSRVRALRALPEKSVPKRSAGYAILYVPSEAFLADALREDVGLWEWAFEQNVLVATPDEMRQMLRALSDAWTKVEQDA